MRVSTLPVKAEPRQEASLFHRLLTLETEAPGLCPEALDASAVETNVADLAAGLRKSLEGVDAPADRMRALDRLLFERLGLRASADLHDPCNLLLSGVLAKRQGYCVGLAALSLVLAEKAGLPVYAVATPAHVFLRYDDGRTRINDDPTLAGTELPDAHYIDSERIASRSVARGVFLRNLTTDEMLAQVHNNLGVIYSERRAHARAAAEYAKALDLDPRLPAAWYNWGNDLLTSAEYEKAIKDFTRSLRLHPNDVWALNNRGVAYRKLDRDAKARRDFQTALQIDPGFEQARRNLDELTARPESP